MVWMMFKLNYLYYGVVFMSKTKSIIIVGLVAVILAVVLIVVLHPSGTGKDAENKMEVTTANYQTDEADDNNSMDNESAEGETNYWDSVDMIEDGNAADNEGNNENTADEQVSGNSEEYPGQDDGWSPIVPADDVN